MGRPLALLLTLAVTGLPMMSDGARILAMLPSSPPSHHMIIQPILRALAEAGHHVVVYSIHPPKNPHPNYIDMSLATDTTKKFNLTEMTMRLSRGSPSDCLLNIFMTYEVLLNRTFENENVKKLLISKENFDLVITEPFIAQEFTFIFGYIFKAPTIGIQTLMTTSISSVHLGNSLSIASIPDVCLPHSNKMTYFERVKNFISMARNLFIYYYHHLPAVENSMKIYFPDMPPLQELTRNLSLMFINDHLTADYPQPRPPNMVPIGGIHIEPEKQLPQDIKKFMDEAKDGVVLISLGTLVPDDERPKEFFDGLVNVFKSLRQRVIWKTKKSNIEGLTDNVMLTKWMPQREVLAHPNCVLFITHGGLASQHETIYSGVPVIGIPYFADQHRNVEFYVAQGVGLRIMPNDISEDTVGVAINTILEETKYRDNMRRLSRIFRDTPMSPKQSVVYWTEYVIRHSGAPHLMPAVVDLTWYQRTLLDVIALLLITIFCTVTVFYFIFRKFLTLFRTQAKVTVVPNKKLN